MGYPKKHRGRRKMGSKKDVLEKKIRKNNFFERYNKIRKYSLYIFFVPLIAVNICLLIVIYGGDF